MTPTTVIPRSASDEGSPLMQEGYGLLELHPEMTLSFSRGKSERWDFTPSIQSRRFLTSFGMYRVVSIPFTENFKVFMKFILAL